ncbi:septal ring lytic transglycosylase RlpA family protein [Mesorhizobium sp. SP-1A]|uniref:septal ring lytic transglycosylase RlpA family protein n=1 Tax=Mesorhizobium sp. SP-1A TaxID=3077840 RepID=UPI0028F738F2|nr:septal ring lytic transglycosylase RlpA family protein [Mesorhizobium sp. SP-1A]
MQTSARLRIRRASGFVLLAASASLLAACATPQPKATVHKRSKEYFAESEYGVKASPRVFTGRFIPRGGGRDQLGKPYQVRGKWYYPKEDKRYVKTGAASWYGDAFHGRLTANGEVYDTEHLTGAHPTMPLPSYARVTNLANGSSVIVRVNDRGPYHEGRIIDLSRRAAEMLDYANIGTAQVKVEYVGRAPLDGNDDQYLMASYRPGKKFDPSVGLPTGVMIAMNGSTPSGSAAAAVPFPQQSPDLNSAPQPVMSAQAPSFDSPALPDFGPIVQERPDIGGQPSRVPFAMASLSYADARIQNAARVFDAVDRGGQARDIANAWKRANPAAAATYSQDYVAAATYESAADANTLAAVLGDVGRVGIERTRHDGKLWYSVNLYPDGHADIDTMLQAAWSHGATDAIAVRD